MVRRVKSGRRSGLEDAAVVRWFRGSFGPYCPWTDRGSRENGDLFVKSSRNSSVLNSGVRVLSLKPWMNLHADSLSALGNIKTTSLSTLEMECTGFEFFLTIIPMTSTALMLLMLGNAVANFDSAATETFFAAWVHVMPVITP